nr:polypeptide N-acetylgalactosaminyltransferase 10 [Paramormyrops kingsleyae]
MRRKQKRLLQLAGLLLAALLFLPNVGLWSLYRDRVFENSPGIADGPAGIAQIQSDLLRMVESDRACISEREAKRPARPCGRTDSLSGSRRFAEKLLRRLFAEPAGCPPSGLRLRGVIGARSRHYSSRHAHLLFRRGIAEPPHRLAVLPVAGPGVLSAGGLCKRKLYAEKLPNTSVIIPFHNEGWSSLLRTVHSVLNRSPPELVAEIILVDDFSDKEHLKASLEEYMVRMPKVRILRTKKREGLIRTRLLGASAARGEVITFLDSHCEANVNWLPPLLDRIAQNRKSIVCPMIDVIDHDNFGYETQAGDAMRGAFDWEMYYKRIPIPAELQKEDPSEPFESPVMAGGLFAVNRKWFWELGGYDAGLEIWGGEQYEISFKVWMCGGRMEDIPCSRVGHIYRKYVPYKVPGGVSLARNLKRVAEVWMDEYAEYIYQRRPEYRHLSAGDVASQKELRSSLGCKSFKWFMAEVAWDLPKHYPPVEPPAAAWGELRNSGGGLCVESKHFASGSPIRLEKCQKGRGEAGWSHGQVRALPPPPPTQDKSLYHPVSNSCMDGSTSEKKVFMSTCDSSSPSQRWIFEKTNSTVLEQFGNDI